MLRYLFWVSVSATGLGPNAVGITLQSSALSADHIMFDVSRRCIDANGDVKLGAPRFRLSASRLVLERFTETEDSWRASGYDITLFLCGCTEDRKGGLVISAREARIDLLKGIWLKSAVLKIGSVPVLWLPAFWYPFGKRRSGLLFPKLGYGPSRGAWFTQAIYIVPGDSWDFSLIPGFGTDRGPSFDVEFRWISKRQYRGFARLETLLDLAQDPAGGELGGRAQLRGQLKAEGRRRLYAAETAIRLDIVSDADYRAAFGEKALTRREEFTRSYFHGGVNWGPHHRLGWDLLVLENLRFRGAQARRRESVFWSLDGPLAGRQRILELRHDDLLRTWNKRFSSSGRWLISVHGGLDSSDLSFVRSDIRRQWGATLLKVAALGLSSTVDIVGRFGAWVGGEGAASGIGYLKSTNWMERDSGTWLYRFGLTHALAPYRANWGEPSRFFVGDDVDSLGTFHQTLTWVELEAGTTVGPFVRALGQWGIDWDVPFGRAGEGLSDLRLELTIGVGRQFSTRVYALLNTQRPSSSAFGGHFELIHQQTRIALSYQRLGDSVPAWPQVAAEELVPSPNRPRSTRELRARYLSSNEELRPWTRLDALRFEMSTEVGRGLGVGAELDFAWDLGRRLAAIDILGVSPLRNAEAYLSIDPTCGCVQMRLFARASRDLDDLSFGLRFSFTAENL